MNHAGIVPTDSPIGRGCPCCRTVHDLGTRNDLVAEYRKLCPYHTGYADALASVQEWGPRADETRKELNHWKAEALAATRLLDEHGNHIPLDDAATLPHDLVVYANARAARESASRKCPLGAYS